MFHARGDGVVVFDLVEEGFGGVVAPDAVGDAEGDGAGGAGGYVEPVEWRAPGDGLEGFEDEAEEADAEDDAQGAAEGGAVDGVRKAVDEDGEDEVGDVVPCFVGMGIGAEADAHLEFVHGGHGQECQHEECDEEGGEEELSPDGIRVEHTYLAKGCVSS